MKAAPGYHHIKMDDLKNARIFPFSLYLYHPELKRYIPFLTPNAPLTKSKKELLDLTLAINGRVAITEISKKLFFATIGSSEETYLGPDDDDDVVLLPSTPAVIESDNELFALLKKCMESQDFMPLIMQAKNELIEFDKNLSPTNAWAIILANELLTTHNFTSKVVAFSYFIAKYLLGIKSEKNLSILVCAGFFHHIGLLQFSSELTTTPHMQMSTEQKIQFLKHSKMAHHALHRLEFDLDEKVYKIILEHHERYDGSGSPQGKYGNQIEPLSLILGMTSHAFEFSEGLITGEKTSLQETIRKIDAQNPIPGLELSFGAGALKALNIILNANANA